MRLSYGSVPTLTDSLKESDWVSFDFFSSFGGFSSCFYGLTSAFRHQVIDLNVRATSSNVHTCAFTRNRSNLTFEQELT